MSSSSRLSTQSGCQPISTRPRSGMAHEPMPEAVKGKKGTRRPPPAKTPVLRFNQPAKYEELDSIQPPLSETMTML